MVKISGRDTWWRTVIEDCVGEAVVHGMELRSGEEIYIKMKGLRGEELKATFICYNRYYGTMKIEVDDTEMLVKLSHIVYIKKKRGGKSGEGDMSQAG